MMNKRKLISVLLLSCLLLSVAAPAFAAVPTLTLSDVQTLVKQNSSTIDSYELNQSIIRVSIKQMYDQMDLLTGKKGNLAYFRDKMAAAEESGDTMTYQGYYSVYSAVLGGYESAFGNLDDAIFDLSDQISDIEKNRDDVARMIKDLDADLEASAAYLYSNILKLENSRDLIYANIELLQRAQKIAQLRIKLGMATAQDYANANLSVDEMLSTLNTINATITTMKRTLNNFMGQDLDYQFNVVAFDVDVSNITIPTITEEMNQSVIEKDITYLQLKRKISATKKDLKAEDDSLTKSALKNDVTSLELQLNDQQTAVRNNLVSKRNAIIAAKGAYENAVSANKIAQKDLQYAQTRYSLGMISAITLQQQQSVALQKAQEEISTKYDYYFAALDFELYSNSTIANVYNSMRSAM